MLACQQINSNSFKNKITCKLLTYKSYVYPFKCRRKKKRMTVVELLLLQSNTQNHLNERIRKNKIVLDSDNLNPLCRNNYQTSVQMN